MNTHACASEASGKEINSNMFSLRLSRSSLENSRFLNCSQTNSTHTLWFFHCLCRLFVHSTQPIDAYQHDKCNEANKNSDISMQQIHVSKCISAYKFPFSFPFLIPYLLDWLLLAKHVRSVFSVCSHANVQRWSATYRGAQTIIVRFASAQ